MIRDQRGIVYVETLIALPILFIVFASMFTFGHLCAAQLMVQRAASAAARAAVVFLPDDPEYYGRDGAATRADCIKQAARQVLIASPHFEIDDAELDVTWQGAQVAYEPLTVSVRAKYDCSAFLGSFLCGLDRVAEIGSSATLSYQQGFVEQQ